MRLDEEGAGLALVEDGGLDLPLRRMAPSVARLAASAPSIVSTRRAVLRAGRCASGSP